MDITAEIITEFRTHYPNFTQSVKWPDPTLDLALSNGDVETGGKRWGGFVLDHHNLKQRGMFLYAAHWLVTSYPDGAQSAESQSSQARNPLSSKSVGDESVTYNAPTAANINQSGDSWLASTSWGQQFIKLRKRVGMGALTV